MDALGEVNAREQHRDTKSLLFNPHTYDPSISTTSPEDCSGRPSLVRAPGQGNALQNYRECVWYADFLELVAKEHLFAKMGTPAREANGDRDKRWDTSRISAFSEILAFYGLDYWYAWQVTILGLGPIWQSDNASARRRGPVARRWCGVCVRTVGARTRGRHLHHRYGANPGWWRRFRATGGKYYIGNANVARMVSVFGRRSDVDGPDGMCSSRRTASTRTTGWSRTSSRRRCS